MPNVMEKIKAVSGKKSLPKLRIWTSSKRKITYYNDSTAKENCQDDKNKQTGN